MSITQIIRTNVCDMLECIDQQREMEMKQLNPSSPGTNIYVETYNGDSHWNIIPLSSPQT